MQKAIILFLQEHINDGSGHITDLQDRVQDQQAILNQLQTTHMKQSIWNSPNFRSAISRIPEE